MFGLDPGVPIWVTRDGRTVTATMSELAAAQARDELYRYRVYYLNIEAMTVTKTSISGVSKVGDSPGATVTSETGGTYTMSTTGYVLDIDDWGWHGSHKAIHHPLDAKYFVAAMENGQPGDTPYVRRAVDWHFTGTVSLSTVPTPNVITESFATILLA